MQGELTRRTQRVNKIAKLAEKYNIYVVLPIGIKYGSFNKNKAILISDKGNVLYNYDKKNLISALESDFRSNNTEYKTFDTEIGKLGVVICHDINFKDYLNQLSRLGLDSLLIPSWDWDPITEFHSKNLRLRVVENGFNAIKSTMNGITLSFDYKGRYLSYFKPNGYEDHFVLSSVYKRGTKTLYSYIGKYFNYLYLAALIIFVIIGRCSKMNERNNKNKKLKKK